MWSGYWPWWAGVVALGFVSLAYFRLTGRTLGVSGFVWRLVRWRSERAAERVDAALADEEQFMAALMAATAKEVGIPEGLSPAPTEGQAAALSEAGDDDENDRDRLRSEAPRRVPVGMAFTFLCALVGGGFLAALSTGQAGVRTELDPLFHAFFGTGWTAIAVLLGSGVLIGVGTSMAGGCTFGHGLSGCANRQSGSFVVVISFFGTAVAVSFLIGILL